MEKKSSAERKIKKLSERPNREEITINVLSRSYLLATLGWDANTKDERTGKISHQTANTKYTFIWMEIGTHFGSHLQNWPASLWSLLDEPRHCDLNKRTTTTSTTTTKKTQQHIQQGRGAKLSAKRPNEPHDLTTKSSPNEITSYRHRRYIVYWRVEYTHECAQIRVCAPARSPMCLSKINALPACSTFNKNCNKVKWAP